MKEGLYHHTRDRKGLTRGLCIIISGLPYMSSQIYPLVLSGIPPYRLWGLLVIYRFVIPRPSIKVDNMSFDHPANHSEKAEKLETEVEHLNHMLSAVVNQIPWPKPKDQAIPISASPVSES